MLKLKLQYFGHLLQRTDSLEKTLIKKKKKERKDPDTGKDGRREEKGMTEHEVVGWYHRLNGHESESTLGVGDGQGGLECCSPWGRKELDTTERLNSNSNHSDSGSSLVVQASLSQAGVQGRVLGAWLSPPSPAPPEFS